MKKEKICFLFSLFNCLSFSQTLDYKEEMKKLIYDIRSWTTSERIIITQNGSEVYFNKDKKVDSRFLQAVDGAAQESMIFGEPEYNVRTSEERKRYLLDNLKQIQLNEKSIFLVNYTSEEKNKEEIKSFVKVNSFVAEAIESISANSIFKPLNNRNKGNVNELKNVRNFLYLLNPEKFKNTNNYFDALKGTDFDMLIIEPSLNKIFFTKEQIAKLKYRTDGTRRLVIAYFSIGEAEEYRSYWEKKWKPGNPRWIVEENENWKGNYVVEYWSSEWKTIIKAYQQKLDEIGVDGYYLDTIDSFDYFTRRER